MKCIKKEFCTEPEFTEGGFLALGLEFEQGCFFLFFFLFLRSETSQSPGNVFDGLMACLRGFFPSVYEKIYYSGCVHRHPEALIKKFCS